MEEGKVQTYLCLLVQSSMHVGMDYEPLSIMIVERESGQLCMLYGGRYGRPLRIMLVGKEGGPLCIMFVRSEGG